MDFFTFAVQGSHPEPYVIIVKLNPFTISCTCVAGQNGTPCKHRKGILGGFIENALLGPENPEKALETILEAAHKSNALALLNEYEAAGEELRKADTLCNKAYKKYREERLRVISQQVKTDKAVEKAAQVMKKHEDEWLNMNAKKELALNNLRTVFVLPY